MSLCFAVTRDFLRCCVVAFLERMCVDAFVIREEQNSTTTTTLAGYYFLNVFFIKSYK